MRSFVLAVLFFGTLFKASAEILPENLPCMPVLIQIPLSDGNTSYGTGVFLAESDKLFLVTAAHVIFNTHSTNSSELIGPVAMLSAFSRGSSNRNLFRLSLTKLMEKSCVKRHSWHDVAILQIASGPINSTNRLVWVDGVM